MKRKKTLLLIGGALVLICAVAAVTLLTSTGLYDSYAGAYRTTMATPLLEIDTMLTVETEGGSKIVGAGNIKIRDMHGTVNFLNVFEVDGHVYTQFADDAHVYLDIDGEKWKFSIAEGALDICKMPLPTGDFTIDTYLQGLTSLLDGGTIMRLLLMQEIEQRFLRDIKRDGSVFELFPLESLAQRITKSIFDQNASNGTPPSASMKHVQLKATLNEKALSALLCRVAADVTFPAALTLGDEATTVVTVTLHLFFRQPGQATDFALPDTAGYPS